MKSAQPRQLVQILDNRLPLFSKRGNLRRECAASRAEDADDPDLAVPVLLDVIDKGVYCGGYVTPDEIGHERSASLEWEVHPLHPGCFREIQAGEVRHAANARPD